MKYRLMLTSKEWSPPRVKTYRKVIYGGKVTYVILNVDGLKIRKIIRRGLVALKTTDFNLKEINYGDDLFTVYFLYEYNNSIDINKFYEYYDYLTSPDIEIFILGLKLIENEQIR